MEKPLLCSFGQPGYIPDFALRAIAFFSYLAGW